LPIAGFTRFRQWAFSAAQSAHGTAATPSGAVPWRGTPEINPNWDDIDDDVDVGSVDPVLEPFRTHTDTTVTLEGPLDYDSIPIIGNAGIRGGVAPTGATAKTWVHTGLSLTATTLDELSAQWGDDFGQDDSRFRDGVIEQTELTFDEGLGPWQVSTQWYFGSVDTHVTRVSGLLVPSNLPLVFGADTALYIDNTAAGIGGTQISDALHSARITITNTIDKKRFANGSNSRFAVSGYGFAQREIEAEFTFAKTAAIAGSVSTSELRKWLAGDAVNRYLSVVATSTKNIPGTSTPYSWTLNLAGHWRTKGDTEVENNSAITLMLKGKYDSTLGYAIRSTVVNANAALP
jgi:hypothetical protein